jgi:hypothetical protein
VIRDVGGLRGHLVAQLSSQVRREICFFVTEWLNETRHPGMKSGG